MREVPISREQAFEDEMQKQVGELGKEVILKGAKDSSGRTLFQNLLERTDKPPKEAADYLARFIS